MAGYHVTSFIVTLAIFGAFTSTYGATTQGSMQAGDEATTMELSTTITTAKDTPPTTNPPERPETEGTSSPMSSSSTENPEAMNPSVGVVRPTSQTTLSQSKTSGSSPGSSTQATTTKREPPAPPSDPPQDASLTVVIIGGAAVIIVIIVLITAICLCYMASRNHKSPPPSDGGNFKPNDVRVVARNGHSTQNQPSATISSINEHSTRLGEMDTLPSNNPLNQANSAIYSRDIHTADRGRSPSPDAYSRDIHTSEGVSESPTGSQRSTSKTNSLNNQPARSRPGSNNIFDKIDPTTGETVELELSPTVSPSSSSAGKDSDHDKDRDSGQPQPVVRRNIPNAQDNLLKRPTPQPRPRLTLTKEEGAEESGSTGDSASSPGSPESPKDNRPFKKGKGPDGSDQAALLANVLRKTPRPLSHVATEDDGETKYW